MVKSLCFLEHMAEGQPSSGYSLILSQKAARENKMFKVFFLSFLSLSMSLFQELTFVPQLVNINDRVTSVAKTASRNLLYS